MRVFRATAAGLCTLACVSGTTSTARAQTQPVMTSRPTVTWIGFGRPGDTSGSSGHADRMGELAIEPLRLTLFGSHPPMPFNTPGCSDQLAEMRTGSGGSPILKTFATNLIGGPSSSWKTPRLTLFGFSRTGCTFDGAAGGGASFIVPIRNDIFFAAGGGAIFLPATSTGSPSGSTAIRADVVFARPGGHSFSIGVGSSKGMSGVNFGGVF
jgi:hypothetical protein